jgi:AraC-like DNA-binding protein
VQIKPPEFLEPRIRRAFAQVHEGVLRFAGEKQLFWGYETRRAGTSYYWDGSKRGISRQRPQVLFQYTLAGHGKYAEKEKLWSLPPGKGFIAILPSHHRYYLPKDSEEWTFFWLIVQHPFVLERARELLQTETAVQSWKMESPALKSAVNLFEAACLGKLRESWALEEALFSWLFATERELHRRRYPQGERQRLLEETRRIVCGRLQSPPGAEELARFHRLERTTFSRKFKATTGISPAAFVTEVRVQEALKLLRTEAKLEDIATSTGFADANHFCKVFRRHFHTSPGSYRQLMFRK